MVFLWLDFKCCALGFCGHYTFELTLKIGFVVLFVGLVLLYLDAFWILRASLVIAFTLLCVWFAFGWFCCVCV